MHDRTKKRTKKLFKAYQFNAEFDDQ